MKIRIWAWEFDFNAMEAKIYGMRTESNDFTEVKLITRNGELFFNYKNGCKVIKPILVANTGYSDFDEAVKRAWTDYNFEKIILTQDKE